MLYYQHNLKEQKLEEKRRQKEEELRRKCTFKPDLRQTSDYSTYRASSSMHRRPAKPSEVTERLYEVQTEKFVMLNQIKQDKKEKKEMAELQNCTFFPKTNEIDTLEELHKKHNKGEIPKNYYKSIGRIRVANEKNADFKRRLEHIPVGENYEKRKNEPFNPPSCADPDRKVKTRVPFMYLDVNIAPGKVGRLALCEGDDPASKARSFAAAFQLKPEVETNLMSLIEASLQDHYQNGA